MTWPDDAVIKDFLNLRRDLTLCPKDRTIPFGPAHIGYGWRERLYTIVSGGSVADFTFSKPKVEKILSHEVSVWLNGEKEFKFALKTFLNSKTCKGKPEFKDYYTAHFASVFVQNFYKYFFMDTSELVKKAKRLKAQIPVIKPIAEDLLSFIKEHEELLNLEKTIESPLEGEVEPYESVVLVDNLYRLIEELNGKNRYAHGNVNVSASLPQNLLIKSLHRHFMLFYRFDSPAAIANLISIVNPGVNKRNVYKRLRELSPY